MMELEMRAITPQERLYTYKQSQQITMQTGCVGYLRGDMGKSGTEFWTTWEDCHGDKKTDEFKVELDSVINTLRFTEQGGGMFKSRSALAAYCRTHPEGGFQNDLQEYGFRIDTAQYSYLMRVNSCEKCHNLYVFCYRREWLDRHMKQAEKGIRFISPDYTEKFRIPDGDMVRITIDAGKSSDHVARYIDDSHMEIGQALYHICEFAERMEQGGKTVIPLRSSLPERCYSTLIDTGAVVILKRGETGFYKTKIPFTSKEEAQALVDEYNKKLGVTKAQAEAMQAGSMFGWACPAADPKNYDDQGQPIKPRHRDRGDAR